MTARYIDVGLLGPIEAREASGARLDIPRGRPLTLLALLLTRRDDVVPADAAAEALWPDRPPKDPRNALQLAVSRLRRALAGRAGSLAQPAPDVVVGVAGGYALRLPAGWVDADRFETLAQAGRAQLARNEAADAAGTLRGALRMWRGPAFADVRDEPFAQASIGRLDELRMTALADRVDADLALRRHAQLVAELETLAGEHPLRERLRAQLMLALYGSGRQSEALAVYRDTRRMLIEELGVEPSRELRDAHQLVLRQGELPPMAGPAPPDTVRLRAAARRRLLTCVVAVPHDVNRPGSQPDPEAVRATLLDLRSQIAGICDAYHGTVRDSDAAAFTIVFGWPHSRESDVLNAVVAAWQLVRGRTGGPAGRSAHQPLPLGVGVATGEVVTTPGAEAPFLLGDLAERAAALARAARQGQVLVAPSTWPLVSHAAHGSPAPAGTTYPGDHAAAVALDDIDAHATSIRRRWEGPYIGRTAELGLLDAAFSAVRDRGAGQLVTLLGEPGVGKTRLSLEFERLVRLDAIVLRGRCRLYDEGVPYRPFREIIEQAAGGVAPDQWLMSIGVGQEVRDVVLAVLGRGQERTGGQAAWAIGRVMAAITQRFPAVVIVDDVQHAAPEVLDLLEALAEPLQSMPVLMICLARPELPQDRPGWGRGWRRAATLTLPPLGDAESRLLLAQLIPEGAGAADRGPPAATRSELVATAAGNPLFLEQLARHLQENPDGQTAFPPALHGLLASRLDQLPPDERTLLEHGAVEGDLFHLESVAAGPGPGGSAAIRGPGLDRALDALIRRDLVAPVAGGGLGGRSAVGFRHRLIREAAYAMLTRSDRARLHEQHADWLSQLTPPELAGPARQASHLEQAHEHLLAIGDPERRTAAIAARAAGCSPRRRGRPTAAASWPPRPGSSTAPGGCSGRSQPPQRNCCPSWPPRSSRRERSAARRTSPRSGPARAHGSGCPRCAGDPPWNSSARACTPSPARSMSGPAWMWSGRRASSSLSSATTWAWPGRTICRPSWCG